MILRVKFNKKNYLKYIGHLDLLRLFQRSFSRAAIPVKFSEGFNPHPRFSIASPLSLGIESEEEYMDIEMAERIEAEEFIRRMNQVLPKDIQILEAVYPEDKRSISSLITWALYEIRFATKVDMDLDEAKRIINSWLEREEIIISRLRKKGRKRVMKEENIRPLIGHLDVKGKEGDEIVLQALMKVGEGGNLRPFDFINALNEAEELQMDLDSVLIKRQSLYIGDGEEIYRPVK
ncbi:MAG: DUF2344 domain-containing protein [Tissierellia bacterium]|nr:DUF2344 domain-containing protein [Tissierellia bacterium]